jgi:hypothetical protein
LDLFEFIVGFYVVIAGIGVTLLVKSVGQIIESRDRIQLYWVHTCWLFFIFFAHVNSWFMLWAYRDQPGWTVGEMLMLVSVPIVLYLASHVSVPEIAEHSSVRHDLRTYFYKRHSILLGLVALSILFNLACEYLLLGNAFLTLANWLRLAVLCSLLAGVVSSNSRLHSFIALGLGAVLLFAFTVLDHPIAN